MSEPIESDTEAPLDPACTESGGEEPASAEEQDYEVMRLSAFNAILSPVLGSIMHATVDSMGIHGVPVIGSAVGTVLRPYLKQMREVDMTNAPRAIAEWFAACVKMVEYVQHIQNERAGRIIVP